MAPSTPPPPSSDVLAALTMASTSSVVMSATRTLRTTPLWLTEATGSLMTPGYKRKGPGGSAGAGLRRRQNGELPPPRGMKSRARLERQHDVHDLLAVAWLLHVGQMAA